MTNFLTSWRVFDVVTYFWRICDVMACFLCHDEVFEDMPLLWRHYELFDVMTCFDIMTNFVTSWRVFDVMANGLESWRVVDVMNNLLTSWRIFDVMTNFLTSWRVLRNDELLALWRVFDLVMHFLSFLNFTNFLTSWRTFWRHNTILYNKGEMLLIFETAQCRCLCAYRGICEITHSLNTCFNGIEVASLVMAFG